MIALDSPRQEPAHDACPPLALPICDGAAQRDGLVRQAASERVDFLVRHHADGLGVTLNLVHAAIAPSAASSPSKSRCVGDTAEVFSQSRLSSA